MWGYGRCMFLSSLIRWQAIKIKFNFFDMFGRSERHFSVENIKPSAFGITAGEGARHQHVNKKHLLYFLRFMHKQAILPNEANVICQLPHPVVTFGE